VSLLDDFDRYGTPWRCSLDLTDLFNNTAIEVARPTPLRRDPVGIVPVRSYSERNGIVLLGFFYHVAVAAQGDGIKIFSRGDAVNPGVSKDRIILNAPSGINSIDTTETMQMSVPFCFVPLHPADLSVTPVNGESLYVQKIGSPIDISITLWGIHTTHSFGDFAVSNSPCIFPS